MGWKLEHLPYVRGEWKLSRADAILAAAEDERELRELLREGVAMLEATWGSAEEVCAELESSGQTTWREDGTVSYGQPWDWIRKAKAVLG